MGKQQDPGDIDRQYDVAFRKPPQHTRFKKGRSGNPKGRPIGQKNMNSLITRALNRTVTVTENGRRKKITKREAIVMQLVNKSASADLTAIRMLFGLLSDSPTENQASEAPEVHLEEADRFIMERLRQRLSGGDADV
jgi:uncharacterized protein DUF5681